MGLHEVGRDAEGGGAFGGIEPGDEPARSGPEVMEPAPGAQALGDLIHGVRHLAQLRTDGFHRRQVFGVHQRDEIERRHGIELVRAGMQVLAHGRRTSAAAWAQTRAEP